MSFVYVYLITGESCRGAGQDACPLLSQSLSAVGAEHQCRLHPLGVLQQESGEYKPSEETKKLNSALTEGVTTNVAQT